MYRKMFFADKFYPKDKVILQRFFENVCKKTQLNISNKNYGLILPHAGYIYSGKTALLAIKETFNFGKPERVIVFGTNHTGIGAKPFSVWRTGKWETPFGDVEIDEELTNRLLKIDLFEENYESHLLEHSIEVNLPILKYYFDNFKLVPIIYNFQTLENTKKIVKILNELELNKTLIIASSDLNHYDSHETTLMKDKMLIEKILSKDIIGVFSLKNVVTACGIGPISILISNFDKIKLVYHTTSAETSNDYDYTVGYASFILW